MLSVITRAFSPSLPGPKICPTTSIFLRANSQSSHLCCGCLNHLNLHSLPTLQLLGHCACLFWNNTSVVFSLACVTFETQLNYRRWSSILKRTSVYTSWFENFSWELLQSTAGFLIPGIGHLLYRRREIRQREPLHKPLVRAELDPGQSLRRPSGPPIPPHVLLRQTGYQGQRGTGVKF